MSVLKTLEINLRKAVGKPLTPTGENALAAFLGLPGMERWQPSDLHLAELSTVFAIGLPFSLLGENPSTKKLSKKIAQTFLSQDRLPKSEWSEVQAGAVLARLKAEISYVPRAKVEGTRTPDLRAIWSRDAQLAVEVTRADRRDLHHKVEQGLNALIEVVRPMDQRWHVLAFFSDASDKDALMAALEAVIYLKPGQSADADGRWAIRAVEGDLREEVVGASAKALFAPSWFPSDAPTFMRTSTVVGAGFSPVITLYSLVPAWTYLEPIARKANRPQSDAKMPFLIAMDSAELPRAHERARSDLLESFPAWPRISGVMLFEYRPWAGVERKEFIVSIHANEEAALPLPEPLHTLASGKRLSLDFILS